VNSDTRRTTIVDVSRRAAVSTKTVSRVFNDAPNVSAEVRRRVQRAAAELNYHPNLFAQALVRRRSHLIGLLYDNPSPSYVVNVQTGVIARLQGARYRLMVVPVRADRDSTADIVAQLRAAALDGVVVVPPLSDDLALLDAIEAAGIRLARLAPTRAIDRAAGAMMDDAAAARDIAAHVIALGHRDIAIILGDPSHPSSAQRTAGYRQALDAAGLTLPPSRIAQGCYTVESGVAAGAALLAHTPRPTAILAQNDDMAVGALLAARDAGLDVPADLSIVGFDDSDVSRASWPRITTIRQPLIDMAFAAADLLIAALDEAGPATVRHLPHELLVRASTAPPPVRHGSVATRPDLGH
jgi:LacI family transcriptional regulator